MQQEACVVGCHLQATTVDLLKNPSPEQPQVLFQLRTPFTMIQHAILSLAGQVGRLVRVTWSWASSSSVEQPVEKLPGKYENKISY